MTKEEAQEGLTQKILAANEAHTERMDCSRVDRGRRIWLIGENNPYSSDPHHDLLMWPPESAGGRLCHKILRMSERDYLRSFERRNLLRQPKWSAPKARQAAFELRKQMGHGDAVIMLGRKVFDAVWGDGNWTPFEAFDLNSQYFTLHLLPLPHPSGLCRIWNDTSMIAKARQAVVRLAPELHPLMGFSDSATLEP